MTPVHSTIPIIPSCRALDRKVSAKVRIPEIRFTNRHPDSIPQITHQKNSDQVWGFGQPSKLEEFEKQKMLLKNLHIFKLLPEEQKMVTYLWCHWGWKHWNQKWPTSIRDKMAELRWDQRYLKAQKWMKFFLEPRRIEANIRRWTKWCRLFRDNRTLDVVPRLYHLWWWNL